MPIPPPPKRRVTLPVWAGEARAAYLAGEGIVPLSRRFGQHYSTLQYWIDRRVDGEGRIIRDPVPRQRPEGGPRRPVSQEDRRARLITRMWRALEQQMQALEARLAELAPGEQPGEAEARTLGGLARLVKELTALEAARLPETIETGEDGDGTQTGLAAQALRDLLAHRLAGLDAGATAGDAGGDAA